MFKCPYCGAITNKDGICRECDVAHVVPYYGKRQTNASKATIKIRLVLGVLCIALSAITCAVCFADADSIVAGSAIIASIVLLISGIILLAARKTESRIPTSICAVLFWLNLFLCSSAIWNIWIAILGYASFGFGTFLIFSSAKSGKWRIAFVVISALYLAIMVSFGVFVYSNHI